MRRFLWVLVLPVVWVPIVVLVLAADLPLYAWVVGLLVLVGLRRRRAQRSGAAVVAPVEGGAVWSPVVSPRAPGGRF